MENKFNYIKNLDTRGIDNARKRNIRKFTKG